jgi:hypothetical protein
VRIISEIVCVCDIVHFANSSADLQPCIALL